MKKLRIERLSLLSSRPKLFNRVLNLKKSLEYKEYDYVYNIL